MNLSSNSIISTKEQHRFWDKVQQAFSSRKLIFLHGRQISHDVFYSQLTLNAHNLSDTLVRHLLMTEDGVERVVIIDARQTRYIESCSEAELSYSQISNAIELEQRLSGKQRKSDHGGMKRPKKPQLPPQTPLTPQPQLAQAEPNQPATGPAADQTEGMQTQLAVLRKLSTLLQNNSLPPFAVIVLGFESIAQLYQGHQHNLEYIEEIKQWFVLPPNTPHCCFVSLPEISVLAPYMHVTEQDQNVIYAGGPSIEEMISFCNLILHKAYPAEQRAALAEPFATNLAQIADGAMLKTLCSAMKNTGYNLLEAGRFYHRFIGHHLNSQRYEEEALKQQFFKQLQTKFDEVNWRDVFLEPEIKQRISYLFHKFTASSDNRFNSKGILLYGPPGTGKTEIARGLANLGGCYFRPLKLADIKGRYIGESGKNVQAIFNEARASAPTILFIDEIDAIFQIRGGGHQDSFGSDIVNQFLSETDGIDTGRQRVFIVGTTNRIDIVDSAIRSRLEEVYIGLPESAARESLFRKHLNTVLDDSESVISELGLQQLIAKTAGFSGRDIVVLCGLIKTKLETAEPNIINAALRDMRVRLAKDLCSEYFNVTLSETEFQSELAIQQAELDRAVIGYPALKAEVLQLSRFVLQDFKRFQAFNLKPRNGLLLYGPPGNGKTYFAGNLARALGMDFVSATSQQFASSSANDLLRLIDEVFQNCIRLSVLHPVMLFFDEWDALANANIGLSLRGALLKGIDEIRQHPNILLVAATNNYQQLDQGLIREGRFDFHQPMPNPTAEDMVQLFDGFLSDNQHFTHSCTPAELIQLSQCLVASEADRMAQGGTSISTIEQLSTAAKQQALLSATSPQAGSQLSVSYELLAQQIDQWRQSKETEFGYRPQG